MAPMVAYGLMPVPGGNAATLGGTPCEQRGKDKYSISQGMDNIWLVYAKDARRQ